MKIQRRFKIQRRHFDPEFKTGEYAEIRLRGKWLIEAGFLPDKMATVWIDKYEKRLVIVVN